MLTIRIIPKISVRPAAEQEEQRAVRHAVEELRDPEFHLDGGPRRPPKPPNARPAPGDPGRASGLRSFLGPRRPPKPPNARPAPGDPWRASGSRSFLAGLDGPPNPPTLGPPRGTRGAPRDRARFCGPRRPPKPPTLGPPRGTRGAPRDRARFCGPRRPPTPNARPASTFHGFRSHGGAILLRSDAGTSPVAQRLKVAQGFTVTASTARARRSPGSRRPSARAPGRARAAKTT